jgi:predicted nucleotidyltransferase
MEISSKLINTLTKVANILNNLSASYCLIGGLAVSMLSKPRATEDVDFLILLENEILKQSLIKELGDKFSIIQNKKPFSLKNVNIWRILLKDSDSEDYDFTILDFIIAENEVYTNALKDPLKIKIDNININVINIENLIMIKELSARKIDLIDIEELKKEL